MKKIVLGCALAFLVGAAGAGADEVEIAPQAERDAAAALDGPKESKGVESVKKLGRLPLKGELPGGEGRSMRVREITLLPGGVVAVHRHDSRVGVAYILEGEVVEHRSDRDVGVVRGVGEVAFETAGLAHWWENKSEGKVRALIVDIVVDGSGP